jgi:mRNA interferase RelE/StbE
VAWTIKYSEIAAKQLKKMDKSIANQIDNYLTQKVAKQKNPQIFGKPLGHNKTGLWRYRVGDHRVICSLSKNELFVLVLRIGHRKTVYD